MNALPYIVQYRGFIVEQTWHLYFPDILSVTLCNLGVHLTILLRFNLKHHQPQGENGYGGAVVVPPVLQRIGSLTPDHNDDDYADDVDDGDDDDAADDDDFALDDDINGSYHRFIQRSPGTV